VKKIRLRCPCGVLLTSSDEDGLVETAQEHLTQEHPKLAGEYSREQILSMSF
jgi:hypothetical protein